MCHRTWLIFVILVDMGFCHVGQAGLKLLISSDRPTLATQSAGITGVQDQPGQHGETPSLLKLQNKKISQALWQVPVIPATQDPEAGEALEPGRQRLQLEYHGTISTHCNPCLLGTHDSPASTSQVAGITGTHYHTWLIFVFSVNTAFHHVGQADLELVTSVQKISRTWWCVPVVPATREAEAGELLEPENGSCSEPGSRLPPAWDGLRLKKKKKRREKKREIQDGRLLAAQDCSSQRKRTEREDATFSEKFLLLMD
ncbi:Zinc finger protein [Plecturocebus cupreus]